MSILHYLQLQPVDPQEDGTISDLDDYAQDETIDLQSDIDEQTLDEAWNHIVEDLKSDPDPLNFADSDE